MSLSDAFNSEFKKKDRLKGRVSKWFDDKGYGFVVVGGNETFIHVSKFRGHTFGSKVNVRVGSIVSGIVMKAMKGKQLFDVEIESYWSSRSSTVIDKCDILRIIWKDAKIF